MIALSWPKTTRLQVALEAGQHLLGRRLTTVLGGMRAIVAMVASTSVDADGLLALAFGGSSICAAPVSSITSIALSGSLRSLM